MIKKVGNMRNIKIITFRERNLKRLPEEDTLAGSNGFVAALAVNPEKRHAILTEDSWVFMDGHEVFVPLFQKSPESIVEYDLVNFQNTKEIEPIVVISKNNEGYLSGLMISY